MRTLTSEGLDTVLIGIWGLQIATLESHGGNVTAVAWHCEGKWLATGSEDGTVKIWDTRCAPHLPIWSPPLTLPSRRTSAIQRDYNHGSPVNDVVVHPNQGELISCDQAGSVKIWDLGANTCTHELVPAEDVPIRSVTIASDGNTLIAGNNKVGVLMVSARRLLTEGLSGELLRLEDFAGRGSGQARGDDGL